MSAFTRISDAQLDALLAPHGLKADHWQVAAEGIENSNYFVTTDDGRELVLTILEQTPVEALDWFVSLLEQLDTLGLPVAVPLRAGDRAVATFQGKPVLLVPRLPGEHVTAPTAAHCRAIGALLATLHGCRMARPGEHDGPAEQLVSLIPLLGKLTREEQEDACPLLEAWAGREGTPVLCHGDLFRDNVLFRGQQVSGLLDLYNAGPELAVWDLAVAGNDWCVHPDGSPDPERERALLMGYGQVRALPMQELSQLPLARTVAALRFRLSRLKETPADAQGRGAKDPEEFARIYRERRKRLG